MTEVLVWLAIGGLCSATLYADYRSGVRRLPRIGGASRSRNLLRRKDSPLLFDALTLLHLLAAIVLILLFTGRLTPLLLETHLGR